MNKTQSKAEIVAHSKNTQEDELISVLATFPRIILAEMNTHRMLSKNTSSSRAIPFKKMIESVQNDPFIPIAWQKEHKGMQGTEYVTSQDGIYVCNKGWLEAKDNAIKQELWMNSCGVTKQLCNRLLEPFMWTTMLITGSKEGWDNFFNLRNPVYEYGGLTFKSQNDCYKHFSEHYPKDAEYLSRFSDLDWLKINKGQAEIHMMQLAECIYDAVNESTPKVLVSGEWHIPFEDKIKIDGIQGVKFILKDGSSKYQEAHWITEAKIKISVALAARTSYTVVGEEKELNYENLIALHDRLLSQDPPHSSPLEHCCRALTEDEYINFVKGDVANYVDNSHIFGWINNIKGFMPYRYMVDNNL
jgi:hypothetical protein